MKKALLSIGGLLVLLVALGVGAIYLNNYSRSRNELREQREKRQRTKIRIGDEPQTVRLRLGVPDDVTKDRGTWVYENAVHYGIVGFDSLHKVMAVILFRGSWWIPEDGLTIERNADADETVGGFEAVLGPPCNTTLGEDSSSVEFFYPISKAEHSEDSIYRSRLIRDSVRVLRFLSIDLKKGKSVLASGWQRDLEKRPSCRDPW